MWSEVSVVFPAYNEEENIVTFLNQAREIRNLSYGQALRTGFAAAKFAELLKWRIKWGGIA